MQSINVEIHYDNGDSKKVKITHLNSDFEMDFKEYSYTGKDDFDKNYTKTCYYLKDQVRLSTTLIDWFVKGCPANVRKVLHYIIHHLEYNTNYVTLNNTVICAEEPNIDISAVSHAIKELKEKNIVVKAKDLERYKNDNKVGAKVYIVNHNHIFNGSYMKLKYQLELQKLQEQGNLQEMQWLKGD